MLSSDSSRDVVLERLAAEFVERHRQGERAAKREGKAGGTKAHAGAPIHKTRDVICDARSGPADFLGNGRPAPVPFDQSCGGCIRFDPPCPRSTFKVPHAHLRGLALLKGCKRRDIGLD